MFYHRLNLRFFHYFRSSRTVTWLPRQKEERKEGKKSLTKRENSSRIPWYQSCTSFVRFTSNDLGHRFLFQFHRVNYTLKSSRKGTRCMSIILDRTKGGGVLWYFLKLLLVSSFQRLILQTPIIQPLLVKPSWRSVKNVQRRSLSKRRYTQHLSR